MKNAMKIVYSPGYAADIGEHVFPTEKYGMIIELLLREGAVERGDIIEPEPPDWGDLETVHTREYIDDLKNARRTFRTIPSELPISGEIIRWVILGAGGTRLACETALKEGICFHCGGGFHHAFPDHAEGFCYVNDVAYGVKKTLDSGMIKRAAVIDCDLHQGNGTAYIFGNDDRVFTFSIHQERLYPVKQRSSLDIGLDDYTGDDEYLERLDKALEHIFCNFKPEFCLYVAGADPYKNDLLGNLKLTIDGLKKRDEMVFSRCAENRVPCAVTLAGGYAADVNDTVRIQANTAIAAIECWRKRP
ncbi:MAG: histone deacetylase [Deltaproteobacteria bacterium]|nr:histone deacetylase [Deltaproteobacteria bacterium]